MFAFCETCIEFLLELFVLSEFHRVAETMHVLQGKQQIPEAMCVWRNLALL